MINKLKILLLTSNTGYAHNAAANAIKEWSEFLYGEKVIVEIEYLLENSNPRYQKLVNLYNFIQRNIPWLHNLYYLILEFQQEIQSTNPLKPFIGKQYWTDRLNSFQPDVIISTHCQTNLGYFDLAKRVLEDKLICITYCTEVDGGCGFTHNWINPKVDIFWSQTPEVNKQAIKMGLNPQQMFAGGTLLNRSFYHAPLTDTEKKYFLQKELSLDAEKFTILLGTGGAGANNHLQFLEHLLPLQDSIQVVALCGKNVVTKAKLEEWRSRHPDFALCALPFTDKMATLLQVSSVVVARPGARTAIESIHCGCPMIFNLLGGAMPQELLAMRYFKKRSIANSLSWPKQLKPIIQSWLDFPETYYHLKKSVLEAKLNANPEKIMESLMAEILKKSSKNSDKR
jgi:processive 1,2-diacylglycerol beta-glucosyltransferase